MTMRDNQPCANVHKMTTTRPHQNVPQTSIIHMISHTPPRCEAKGTDAQRQDREHNRSSTFSSVSSDQPCDARVMRHRVRGCTLQRSLNDWPTFAYRSSAHVSLHECTSHSPTTEHHLRTLHHVYETCCCHQLTRSKYSWPFPQSAEDRSPSDLPPATCGRTPVLLAEHVDTKVSRSRSTNQGLIRNLRSNHLCPVPAISSPVSIRPLTHLPSVPQCKRSFSSMP